MKIYPVFIPHAGCPHQCLFCAQDKSNSQQHLPEPGEVKIFLEKVLPVKGDGQVAFYGGTFTMLPSELQESYLSAVEPFVDQGRVGSVRVSTRPDAVSAQALPLLKRYGVKTIELGCQSFSDDVLMKSGRGHAAADNVAAVSRCREAGFSVGIQLMPGLPGDLPETAMSSLHRAEELQPAFLRIYPALVIAGTGLESLWRAGAYEPWSLTTAVDVCAEMLLSCHNKKIPVIRMGLQYDEELAKNYLAGPFHPAFGQLVRSRVWQKSFQGAIKRGNSFFVNPADLSDAFGHRGENRSWLEENFCGCRLMADKSVGRGILRVSGQDLPHYDLAVMENEYARK